MDAPDFAALESEVVVKLDRIVRAVYLGDDHQGVPVYLYSEGSSHIGNLIAQFFLDEGTLFRFGSTYHCCINGPLGGGLVFGEPVTSITTTPATNESVLVTEWHSLPEDVSAVAVQIDGEAVAWQTPTSGTAAFRLTLPTDAFEWETHTVETETGPLEVRDLISTITLVAYDIEGNELART